MARARKFYRSVAIVSTLFFLSVIAPAQTLTVLHSFSGGLDGAYPYVGLSMDHAGNLYGAATYGGFLGNDCNQTDGCGTVFELARQGSGFIFRPLYQFQGYPSPSSDGANPLGRVIIGPDGALYGTTAYGGSNTAGCEDGSEPGCGTVFKLTPPPTICKSFICNWQETRIYNFTGAPDGFLPRGEVAFDADGNLYGATYYGGMSSGGGTVYKLTPAQGTWTQSVLAAFPAGSNPAGGVQLDQAGNVYGTTQLEGTVFQLVPSGSGWTLNDLYNFQVGSGGFDLLAGVIVGPGGNLYGGTVDGAPNGDAVLYAVSPSDGGWAFNALYTFTQSFGGGPGGNLVMDSAGNLYGTTIGDSEDQIYGNVFKLTPSNGGWTYTDLYDFAGGSDGSYPYSNIVIDSAGNLYGTALTGGANGYGVVWELTP